MRAGGVPARSLVALAPLCLLFVLTACSSRAARRAVYAELGLLRPPIADTARIPGAMWRGPDTARVQTILARLGKDGLGAEVMAAGARASALISPGPVFLPGSHLSLVTAHLRQVIMRRSAMGRPGSVVREAGREIAEEAKGRILFSFVLDTPEAIALDGMAAVLANDAGCAVRAEKTVFEVQKINVRWQEGNVLACEYRQVGRFLFPDHAPEGPLLSADTRWLKVSLLPGRTVQTAVFLIDP